MAVKTLLPVLVLTVACASALDVRQIRSSVAPSAAPVDLPQADFVVPLTGKVPRSSFKKQILRELRGHTAGSFTGSIAGAADDEEYITNITVGGQHFTAIVDTGSSDTWLVEQGFECFTLTDTPIPAANCSFGSSGFVPSDSKTFEVFPDKNFNISYVDGEFLTGTVGFDTVTIAGLTVKHQEIGLVTSAAWEGDTVTTGLIGLAYPNLTSVFNGTNPDLDNRTTNAAPYNPFFFSAVQQGLVKAPFFSVALDRGSFAEETNSTVDSHLGVIAFGGIAPVPVTSTVVTVPMKTYAVSAGTSDLLWYLFDVDTYTFTGSEALNTTGTAAILDTGTTLNYVPTAIARAFNALFDPPATFDADQQLFFVDCNATAPAFSVTFGGVAFAVDPADQILPFLNTTSGQVMCYSGTQDGGSPMPNSTFIMGDTFLHNVVATFNIKSNTITVSERVKY